MAKDAKTKLEEFASSLERELGDNLVSLALFGPAVRHDAPDRESDLTTLLILRDASPSELGPIEKIVADWVKKGHEPPLIFAEEGWRSSTDVFPIEIEDMREAHELLRGRDPFEGLQTTREDLRREVEREVMSKLLQVRTHYVAAAPNGKALGDLLIQSAGTFFVLFRAVLRLIGEQPPQEREPLVREAARAAGLDETGFDWVLGMLGHRTVRALKPFDPIGDHFVEQIEQLARFVDAFDTSQIPAGAVRG